MNPLVVLMGLLLLAYVGSFLVSGRAIRGFGLPSGAEYVVLGFVLGPRVLGVVDDTLLSAFDPIAEVALGWLALVIGLDYGLRDKARIRATHILGGALVALFTAAMIGTAVWFVAGAVMPVRGADRILLVGGVAAACAETTRHAVRWVVERHHASGPVSDLLADLAGSDDVVPLMAVAVLFGVHPSAASPWPVHGGAMDACSWGAATLVLGFALGAMGAVLLGHDFRRDESWGVLLGTSLLGIGTAARLGLSTISLMFVVGVTIAAFSRHRAGIRELVAPTERPVLHPALLLAGAHVDPSVPALAFLVLFALAARMTAKALVGIFAQAASPAARSAGPLLGMGLMSSGALAMTVGLAFALRFPGVIGNLVLGTAAAATLLGEFVGPAALRSALKQAGELAPEIEVDEQVRAS